MKRANRKTRASTAERREWMQAQVAALRGAVADVTLPRAMLASGKRVRVGSLVCEGWQPRLPFAATDEQRDAAEEIEFMMGWAAPGAQPWLALGDTGWTREVGQ